MGLNVRSRWLNLLHTLWFLPTLISAGYVALAVGLVHFDAQVKPEDPWVFSGSAHAARTVLSTIAGSLITVAGLTFSVTMIVLQLTSTQFSPRIVAALVRLFERVTDPLLRPLWASRTAR